MKPVSRKFHLTSIITFISLWFLIFLGVSLRAHRADVFPADNNDDGLFYAWAGISFWDNPFRLTSHSIFEAGNPALIWRSQYRDFVPWERFGLKITRPWLDHPPLGAAFIGLPAKLLGYQELQQIPTLIVRFPALFAAIFTLFFTYLLSKKLFGEKIGLLSLLFLTTVPYFVAAHRQSFLDNILTPVFLGSLLAFFNRRYPLTAILAFLCGWIKVPGFSVPFMFGLWLWRQKQTKLAAKFILTGTASILAYLGYGLLSGKDAFFYILSQQSIRGVFPRSFFDTLTHPHFYGGFEDGWYVLGLALTFWVLTKTKLKKFRWYSWFLSMWLIVLFLVTGRVNNSPWYYYPLLPFLAINLGLFTNQALTANSLFLILPFWLLGWTGFDLLKMEIPSLWLRLITLIFFTPFVLNLKTINYWLTRVLLAALVLFNIYVTWYYPSIYCRDEKCPPPIKINAQN